MAALTERKKREIEMLYRKMKEKPSKVFLNVSLNESFFSEEPTLPKHILNFIQHMEGIESSVYSVGSNNITATAQWTETEAKYRVEDLRKTHGVKSVQAKILYPLD
jgi:hypothetical protein